MQYSMIPLSAPEFLKLEPLDVSPYISSCEIKVCYTGANRNATYFTKDVLANIAKTLRGSPIVGGYCEEKGDFTDHCEQISITANGIESETTTIPYGFVSPDARVWFQKFLEKNIETGQEIEREYLMTNGYLWAKQYKAAQQVIDEGGKGQSMEFDLNSFTGEWQEDMGKKPLFIVADANFTKLCILGDDVEPCFETSTIKPISNKQAYSTSYCVEQEFTKEFAENLYSMMEELKNVLEKGGENTVNNEAEENVVVGTNDNVEPAIEEKAVDPSASYKKDDEKKEPAEKDDNKEETDTDGKKSSGPVPNEKAKEAGEEKKEEDKDEEEQKKKNYSLSDADVAAYESLQIELTETKNQYAMLQTKFDELTQKCESLVNFQKAVEDKEKDALINKFYSLSAEEKKDVIDNKDKYSLEEIESKLSVIYTKNRMALEEAEAKAEKVENEPAPAIYSCVDQGVANDIPEFVQALINRKAKNY